ncbi:MAG: hypothetical protein IIV78_04930, partial [Oscillospiraceae bacterium]|nr:hypothetical protein [Oscillospiraceae bacterium]
ICSIDPVQRFLSLLQIRQRGRLEPQDEKKSHGKADTVRLTGSSSPCPGFLTKYCAKRVFGKQFLSYGTSP